MRRSSYPTSSPFTTTHSFSPITFLPLTRLLPCTTTPFRLPPNSSANQCYQLAAEFSGDLGDFSKSIELYEQVGDWSLSSPLTKYSVKEYWLRAALSSMAMGVSEPSCTIPLFTHFWDYYAMRRMEAD